MVEDWWMGIRRLPPDQTLLNRLPVSISAIEDELAVKTSR
jgi:hypothetical protein